MAGSLGDGSPGSPRHTSVSVEAFSEPMALSAPFNPPRVGPPRAWGQGSSTRTGAWAEAPEAGSSAVTQWRPGVAATGNPTPVAGNAPRGPVAAVATSTRSRKISMRARAGNPRPDTI